MICPNCQKNLEWKDFYGKNVCYKCVYQEKLRRVKSVCPLCRGDIPKGRWKYCSEKCADIGAFTQRAEYQHNIRNICVNNRNWKDTDFSLSKKRDESFDRNYGYV